MRRRITLLVAATTSIVLLAFLLPAASLVARVAEARALDTAQAQLQFLVPAVGLDSREQVAAALIGTSGELDVGVRWTDGEWLGEEGGDDVPTSPTTTETAAGTRLVQPVQRVDGTAVVDVFVPADVLRAGVTRTWVVLTGLGLVLLVLALVVADRLARSLTRPVTDLAATTQRLGSGDLDARATPTGPPEVREVATAVNRLAGRIGELLTAEREGAADLAHRLRTPLTALRLDVEGLSAGDRERLLADVDALSRGIDDVINEARRTSREGLEARCDALRVARERTEFWSVLAVDEAHPLRLAVASEDPLPVRVAAVDLAAAVDALLGNVFAHTPPGTRVDVDVQPRAGGGAELTVRDDGPGFDPAEAGRGRSGAGSTGLGLDIARRTAEASGGSLRVDTSPSGTTVVMVLGPAAGTGGAAPRR